tara:strand:- start:765 stop:965 length:201 start_codon:yes stop_codon:yes gene_type:complete
MTRGFGENFLSINYRLGVGIDLEFADSRAVWVTNSETEEINAASFEGVVIMLPFTVITFGKIWTED